MERDSFVFLRDWWECIRDESEEIKAEVLCAVLGYVFDGEHDNACGGDMKVRLKPKSEMAFKFIAKDIDRMLDKYETIKKIRSEAGKKGGAPKGNQNSSKNNQKQANSSKNNQNKPNENDNENDNENVFFNTPDGDEKKIEKIILNYFEKNGVENPQNETDRFLAYNKAKKTILTTDNVDEYLALWHVTKQLTEQLRTYTYNEVKKIAGMFPHPDYCWVFGQNTNDGGKLAKVTDCERLGIEIVKRYDK